MHDFVPALEAAPHLAAAVTTMPMVGVSGSAVGNWLADNIVFVLVVIVGIIILTAAITKKLVDAVDGLGVVGHEHDVGPSTTPARVGVVVPPVRRVLVVPAQPRHRHEPRTCVRRGEHGVEAIEAATSLPDGRGHECRSGVGVAAVGVTEHRHNLVPCEREPGLAVVGDEQALAAVLGLVVDVHRGVEAVALLELLHGRMERRRRGCGVELVDLGGRDAWFGAERASPVGGRQAAGGLDRPTAERYAAPISIAARMSSSDHAARICSAFSGETRVIPDARRNASRSSAESVPASKSVVTSVCVVMIVAFLCTHRSCVHEFLLPQSLRSGEAIVKGSALGASEAARMRWAYGGAEAHARPPLPD